MLNSGDFTPVRQTVQLVTQMRISGVIMKNIIVVVVVVVVVVVFVVVVVVGVVFLVIIDVVVFLVIVVVVVDRDEVIQLHVTSKNRSPRQLVTEKIQSSLTFLIGQRVSAIKRGRLWKNVSENSLGENLTW